MRAHEQETERREELELSGAELVAEHTGRMLPASEATGEHDCAECNDPNYVAGSHSSPSESARPIDGETPDYIREYRAKVEAMRALRPGSRPITVDGFPYSTTAPEREEEPEPDLEHEAFCSHHDSEEGR